MMIRTGLVGLLLLAPPVACAQDADRETLTLLTYNVLADPAQADQRIPSLMKILEDSNADVIALQEVDAWFLTRLSRAKWVREKGYAFAQAVIHERSPNGQCILTRLPVEKSTAHRLPGQQRRDVLVARLRVGRRTMLVATTHMESPLEAGDVRAKQLDAIFPLLKDADDAILLGDLNFGDGEQPETSRLDKALSDVWTALKAKDPGYTWNIESSDMAKKGSFPGEKSRRIDRILVRSNFWKPRDIRIVGDTPVTPGKKDLFPSDHFGLVGALERRK